MAAVRPRTFFLNETHEAVLEKPSGGRLPQYVDIPWARKARRLSSSIAEVIREVDASHDPLRNERYFVIAKPESSLKKHSTDIKRAPDGTFSEATSFGGDHGRVFERLGFDLLHVTDDGKAVVHADRERLDQLLTRAKTLTESGSREQVRWATIDLFESIPLQLRVDLTWLKGLSTKEPADVVFELQPVLGRIDADRVLHAIAHLLRQNGERLTGNGTDFSGRVWFRGKASQASVRAIAKDFYSVQSIHSPLVSFAMATRSARTRSGGTGWNVSPDTDTRTMPCVAVVDLGVPTDHILLAPFRRGQFIAPGAITQTAIDHASFVASRIIFGHWDTAEELNQAAGQCTFYDVVIADGRANQINDKLVLGAMNGVRGAAPDVRVFNLSFGHHRPLDAFDDIERREKRLLMQDLDNFAFANDAIIVVAAGNSQPGISPTPTYPNHHADPGWALGPEYVNDFETPGLRN